MLVEIDEQEGRVNGGVTDFIAHMIVHDMVGVGLSQQGDDLRVCESDQSFVVEQVVAHPFSRRQVFVACGGFPPSGVERRPSRVVVADKNSTNATHQHCQFEQGSIPFTPLVLPVCIKPRLTVGEWRCRRQWLHSETASGVRLLKYLIDEGAPDGVGQPNFFEVALSDVFGNAQFVDAVEENEGGDAHVFGAVDKDAAALTGF